MIRKWFNCNCNKTYFIFLLPFHLKKEMKRLETFNKRFHHCEFEKFRVFSVCWWIGWMRWGVIYHLLSTTLVFFCFFFTLFSLVVASRGKAAFFVVFYIQHWHWIVKRSTETKLSLRFPCLLCSYKAATTQRNSSCHFPPQFKPISKLDFIFFIDL